MKFLNNYLYALMRTTKRQGFRWSFVSRYHNVYQDRKEKKLRSLPLERHLRKEQMRAQKQIADGKKYHHDDVFFAPRQSYPTTTLLRKPGKLANTWQVLRLIREQKQ